MVNDYDDANDFDEDGNGGGNNTTTTTTTEYNDTYTKLFVAL